MGFGWSRGGGAPHNYATAPGASVDGSTDAAAAIASASASAIASGKALLFKKGLYGLSELTVPEGAVWVLDPGARFVLEDGAPVSIAGNAIIDVPVPRPQPLARAGLIGDSRANDGYLATGWKSSSVWGWASVYSKGAFVVADGKNFSVGGEGTADLDDQIDALLASGGVDICWILIGTNDAVSVTTQQQVSRIINACFRLLAAGIVPCVIGDLPRSETVSASTDIIRVLRRATATNTMIEPIMHAMGFYWYYPHKVLADQTASTGEPISGYYRDNVHMQDSGAHALGAAVGVDYKKWAGLEDWRGALFPYGAAARYDSTYSPRANLVKNPTLGGSGGTQTNISGNISGNVPSDCAIERSAGGGDAVLTFSLVARPDGEAGQALKMSCAAGSSRTILFLSISSDLPAAGSVVQGGIDMWADGMVDRHYVQARFLTASSPLGAFAEKEYEVVEDWGGRLVTNEMTVPESQTDLIWRIFMDINPANGGDIIIAAPSFHIVG